VLKEKAGLQWNTEKAEDAFLKIYRGGELRGFEDWLIEVRQKCGWSTYFPVVFMAVTGFRTGEAILCLNKKV
jgi:hypothetical protein